MAQQRHPQQRDNIQLTPEQETALDRAWDTITDAEIEESIHWLDEHPVSEPPTIKETTNGR